jgi:hypothetical protein
MISKIYKFLFSKLRLLIIDRNENNFIRHNEALFNNSQNKEDQILIEIHSMQPSHIAISHFLKTFSRIHDAQFVGYQPQIHFSLFNKFKSYIFNLKIKKIYKSFGVNKFLNLNISNYKNLANHLANKLMSKINSKSDLINLNVDDIWIGDLIYDQYLTFHKVPTVDIKSEKFRKILLEFCILYYYWRDYCSKKKISAFLISHTCYFMGLPARIAILLDIPVYLVSLDSIYYLSKKNDTPFVEHYSYKNDFNKLDISVKNMAIEKARGRIKLIFEGSTDLDQLFNINQSYIKHTAYSPKKVFSRILGNKSSVKILIASHSFHDSPNAYGKFLFPDFFEWLEFLGELSNRTDYEWYIKTHPGIDNFDKKTIYDFVSRYNKIILIPNTTSHHQLIEEGINIVLTVHGSIGLEYAAKNITVINASLHNPHISYDFNIHPKSKEELKNIIINLNSYINSNPFSDDVYKCYYMRHLHNNYNIFLSNYKDVEKQFEGHYGLFSSKIYEYWINNFTPYIQSKIELNLKTFILSGDYKLKSPSW